jgi:hypothetical protein
MRPRHYGDRQVLEVGMKPRATPTTLQHCPIMISYNRRRNTWSQSTHGGDTNSQLSMNIFHSWQGAAVAPVNVRDAFGNPT